MRCAHWLVGACMAAAAALQTAVICDRITPNNTPSFAGTRCGIFLRDFCSHPGYGLKSGKPIQAFRKSPSDPIRAIK